MSNQNERKKKDGRDKNKKLQAMRASERERHEKAGPERRSVDEVDKLKFKPGSGSDDKGGRSISHAR